MTVGTGAPTNFKPFTSYRWAKKTSQPNPYLAATQDKLKRAEDEFAAKTTAADRKRDLRNANPAPPRESPPPQKVSFPHGAAEPYIVVPGAFAPQKEGAKTGDYA